MSLLGNVISGAIGYGISEVSKSHLVTDFCDMYFSKKTIEEIVDDYAHKRLDIWGYNNDFARRLHEIAKKFEDYDYDNDGD